MNKLVYLGPSILEISDQNMKQKLNYVTWTQTALWPT